MHYLDTLAKAVDKTHLDLGNLLVVAMLATKAKKLLLVVSPRGCGKSRISSFVALSHPKAMLQDRLSAAGLAQVATEMTNFDGVLVVDDIAKTQTHYARITTITTLAELVYSHYCISHMAGGSYEITDFYGAAIVNLQPVLLRELVRSHEWEASIQDKSMRYYHMKRPQRPNPLPPTVKLEWGIDIAEVETPPLRGKVFRDLMDIGESQWGLSRLQEHIADLLRASAALDKRTKVIPADFRLLRRVLQPMRVEELVLDKKAFESNRYLNSNQLAVLTEFVTYGQFTLRQISRDYKLSQGQCYAIMAKFVSDWKIVAMNPTVYAPTDELMERLRKVGIR